MELCQNTSTMSIPNGIFSSMATHGKETSSIHNHPSLEKGSLLNSHASPSQNSSEKVDVFKDKKDKTPLTIKSSCLPNQSDTDKKYISSCNSSPHPQNSFHPSSSPSYESNENDRSTPCASTPNLSTKSTTATLFSSTSHLRDLDLIQNKLSELENEVNHEEQDDLLLEKAYKRTMKEVNGILNSGATTDMKIDNLRQKLITTILENKKSNGELLKIKRLEDHNMKEKNYIKMELAKALTLKLQLENLCRGLQKENKRIKEEMKMLSLSEQKRRDELSNKFEVAITEISNRIDHVDSQQQQLFHSPDNNVISQSQSLTVVSEQKKPNLEEETDKLEYEQEGFRQLKEKFQGFLEQYELREKHFNAIVKQKDIEIKLLTAKLNYASQNIEQSQVQRSSLKNRLSELEQSESQLKEQLNHYVDKFKQVEETLSKSNELFAMFRKEIEYMTSRVSKLEKEKNSLKNQCESLSKTIYELVEEKNSSSNILEGQNEKRLKLENLCRALHMQRNNAISLLQKYKHVISLDDYNSFIENSSSSHSLNMLKDKSGEREREKLVYINKNDKLAMQINPRKEMKNDNDIGNINSFTNSLTTTVPPIFGTPLDNISSTIESIPSKAESFISHSSETGDGKERVNAATQGTNQSLTNLYENDVVHSKIQEGTIDSSGNLDSKK